MTDITIKVQNLSKCYHIYVDPRERINQFLAPRLQRLARQTPKHYFREFWAIIFVLLVANSYLTLSDYSKLVIPALNRFQCHGW